MSHGPGGRLVEFSGETSLAASGLVALASAGRDRPLEAAAVAEEAGAGVGQMQEALASLVRAGLVEADGDGSGPFRLSRTPGKISFYEIAEAVGERFHVFWCLNGRGLDTKSCRDCVFGRVCSEVKGDVVSVLRSRTVGDLVGEQTRDGVMTQ